MTRIWHGARLEIAPEREPPFAVDALVVEDDTWRVLGADPTFRPAADHPIRVMRSLRRAEPVAPGSVIVEAGVPTRLYAIVHDLDHTPSWREQWIAGALREILRLSAARGLRALGLPLLGTRHGRLDPKRAWELLDRALCEGSARPPRRLWLICERR